MSQQRYGQAAAVDDEPPSPRNLPGSVVDLLDDGNENGNGDAVGRRRTTTRPLRVCTTTLGTAPPWSSASLLNDSSLEGHGVTSPTARSGSRWFQRRSSQQQQPPAQLREQQQVILDVAPRPDAPFLSAPVHPSSPWSSIRLPSILSRALPTSATRSIANDSASSRSPAVAQWQHRVRTSSVALPRPSSTTSDAPRLEHSRSFASTGSDDVTLYDVDTRLHRGVDLSVPPLAMTASRASPLQARPSRTMIPAWNMGSSGSMPTSPYGREIDATCSLLGPYETRVPSRAMSIDTLALVGVSSRSGNDSDDSSSAYTTAKFKRRSSVRGADTASIASSTSTSGGCFASYQALPKLQRTLICLSAVIVLLVVFNMLLLTIGVKAIAEYAVRNWYPPQFDIQNFDFDQLTIGPVSGSTIGVSIAARMPEALPVDVKIRRPMIVEVLYVLPQRVNEAYLLKRQAAERHDTAQIKSVHTDADDTFATTPEHATMLIGTAKMNDEAMELSSQVGASATMNITLHVDDPVAFARMADHLLAFVANETVVGIDRRNYSEPVVLQVNVLVSAVDVLLFNTPMLTIPNLSVQKTVLLKDPTLPERIDRAGGTAAADTSVGSVGSFLTLLSRVLGGDPEVLRHTSDFIGLSNLTLYDEAFGNSPPAIFATLGPYEFAHREVEVLASKKAARTLRNASNKAQADKNSEDRESLLHRVKLLNDTVAVPGTTASMLGSSAELEDNDTIALGLGDVHPRGDPNSLPFSLLVTFRNPTNIQLDFLGTFMVDLKYADVTIANVTIPDMRLDANGSTAVMVYGYLRKIPGQEHILEQDVPKAVLRAMSSGIYAPLPFSLSGTIIDPLFFTSRRPWAQRQQLTGHSSIVDSSVSSSAQDATAAMVSEPLQLAVQSMLSQRSVLIGHHYAELGPRAPGVNGSIALARIFEKFPVLGANGLGDMLHSVKLNLGWKILGGQIPTTVWLANPFSCAIGLRKLSLRVYAQPSADSVLLGWVSMPDLDRRGRRRDSDDSTRYGMPELLPPYSHMDMASVFYFRNTSIPGVNDTETLMREETPRYVFKLNMGGLVLDSKDALRQLASSLKQRQFIVSAAVDDLQVRIGRFEWRMTNITEHDLVNLPLFPRHVVEKVGWPRLFRSLFGDGWVMVDDEANVFKPPPPRESLTTTIVGTMPLPTLGPEES